VNEGDVYTREAESAGGLVEGYARPGVVWSRRVINNQ